MKKKWLRLARRIGRSSTRDDINLNLILDALRANDDNLDALSCYSDQNDYNSSCSTNVENIKKSDCSNPDFVIGKTIGSAKTEVRFDNVDTRGEKGNADDFWLHFEKMSINNENEGKEEEMAGWQQ